MSSQNFPANFGPLGDYEPEEIASLLLASIAFEEFSLAHIMNAEGDKLQRALGLPPLVNGPEPVEVEASGWFPFDPA